MDNPPAKPTRPRISKRALALLIVLGAAVWGVASLARPRPPFRFLANFTSIKQQKDPYPGFAGHDEIHVYSGLARYDEVCNAAARELLTNGWTEGPRSRTEMEFTRFSESGFALAKLYIHDGVKSDGRFDTEQVIPEWTTLHFVRFASSASVGHRTWAGVRGALHL